jgi:predicted O-methyltransferase YrrM
MTREDFFPKRINDMNLTVGVEVGVGQGNHTINILKRSKIKTFYCVDSYHDNFNGIDSGDLRFEEAKMNLKTYIDCGRVHLLRGESVEIASSFDDNFFDFCYIDGDHSYRGIKGDFEAWFCKLKNGGLFCGHDYKNKGGCGVKRFIDEFCTVNDYKLGVVGRVAPSWWIIKK